MFRFIYKCVFFVIRLILPFLKRTYPKLKERELYTQQTFAQLRDFRHHHQSSIVLWIHAASTGEFEQAKPVIEQIKQNIPNCAVCVSFFSPSGYNAHKDYALSDCVVYLPLDIKNNAKKFIEELSPQFAIFIRYDFWYNYLYFLQSKSIPVFSICTTISASLPKNFLYSLYYNKVLQLCTRVYAANKDEYQKIKEYFPDVTAESSSDTRFDRIISIVEQQAALELTKEDFHSEKPIIVAGSTWREDEHLFFQMYISDKKTLPFTLILVPHEPTPVHVQQLKSMFTQSILWSDIEKNPDIYRENIPSTIIVDSIGKLLRIYSLADAAYIGGGFGSGVHSTAEPAGYGIPLCSGRFIDRSPDALALRKDKALTVIENTQELRQWISLVVMNKEARLRRGFYARNYIYSRQGATKKIQSDIVEMLHKQGNMLIPQE